MGDVSILYRGNHLSLVQPRHGRSIEFVTMVPLGRKVTRRRSGGEEEVLKIPQQRVYAGPDGWQSSSIAFQGCFLGQVKCVLIFEFV